MQSDIKQNIKNIDCNNDKNEKQDNDIDMIDMNDMNINNMNNMNIIKSKKKVDKKTMQERKKEINNNLYSKKTKWLASFDIRRAAMDYCLNHARL